ncbi:MAG: AI-2E family transporter [Patescibacteria group bacterium]|jgi:predicted PurR-regulated permease PerM|nr:AI-2E family transporter [Patescibacteria group bacterium]
MPEEVKKIEISWMSFWRLILLIIILALVYVLRSIFVMLFVAIIIAAAFSPLVDRLEKKRIPRFLGAAAIYLFILILLAIVLYFSFPIVYEQILNIGSLLPGFSEKILGSATTSQLGEKILDFLTTYQGSLFEDAGKFFAILFNLGGGIVSVVTVFLISFYLLIKKDGVADFIKFVLPISIEESVLRIWYRSKLRLGKWLRTQILLSGFIGIMVLAAMLILGVKYAFILAVFAALCELVPVVGPILAGIVATLIALTQSVPLALWTALVFILIQRLENDILIPLVMKKTIGFNPVIVIVGLLIGAKLGGVVGVLIALPTIIVIEETIKELNNKKQYSPLPLP